MTQTISKLDRYIATPPPYEKSFRGGINHPHLYLWDVWSAKQNDVIHLYCLAVDRFRPDGSLLTSGDRNSERFHVRHFHSVDSGATWEDRGCFQRPRLPRGLFDSGTIWSGSILPLSDHEQLVAYTGIREPAGDLMFQQSLALARSRNWESIVPESNESVSDALHDWQCITEQGYFLGDKNILGHKDGESDGPILSWRDPFLFGHQGQLHLFWGAKLTSRTPVLGHGILAESESGFTLSHLSPPIVLPDGDEYTQLELPKVMYDRKRKTYYLIIGSCNRLHEQQSDAQIDKQVRMYRSDSLEGPWSCFGHHGSKLVLAEPHMFGITVIETDFSTRKLYYIAPYTERAGPDKMLTLSSRQCLDLDELG